MEDVPQSSMSIGLVDRRNNSVLSSVPVADSDNPLILPPPDTVVWHYVRFDYFQKLLLNRAIWFTRLDRQSDKNDGMYSEANAHQMTPVVHELMDGSGFKIREGEDYWQQLQGTNQVLRRKTFVHCWSIRVRELAWMWHSFIGDNPRSIALQSTVGHLLAAIHGQPVEARRQLYYPAEQPRPDWSYTAPFSAKDRSYARERELRLLTIIGDGVAEMPEYKLIPVDLKMMIRKAVIHPSGSVDFRSEVQAELAGHGIHVNAAKSQLRPCDLEAIASSHKH
ncbi:MAG: hypothetical protein ABSA69_03575 [Verrucomicrobiota bacterium]|jgi:hypothetical protein